MDSVRNLRLGAGAALALAFEEAGAVDLGEVDWTQGLGAAEETRDSVGVAPTTDMARLAA